MVTKLGDIEIREVFHDEQDTLRIKGLTFEIEFGESGTKAAILIRRDQSVPDSPENIRDDVRLLAEALQRRPQVSDLTFSITFGDPGTRATIVIRHAQSMPNTHANI